MRNAGYQQFPEREAEALTFGRYALTRKLSQGGMAEIYLARQSGIENFEKEVVVKIVLPTLADDDGYEDMLLNEARMAARLNHPNIVQILDLGKLDGRFFIAMEYLEGQNLLSIIQRAIKTGYALPLGFICRVIADVLGGLDYAHAQTDPATGRSLGIIHRDISPPNVIVTYAGTTKLVDFGIAKATGAVSSSVTQAGQFKGKLSYMSPEQVKRQSLDARTDVFSTGVLLWELVTRKRLFRRQTDIETLRAVVEHEIEPPSVTNPDCPRELDEIVFRSLERTTARRYPTARSMRKALEELIRAQAWPSDSLTVQRVMSDLFGVEEPPLAHPGTAAHPDEATAPTQPTPKVERERAAAARDRPASVEITAAFKPMGDRGSGAIVTTTPPTTPGGEATAHAAEGAPAVPVGAEASAPLMTMTPTPVKAATPPPAPRTMVIGVLTIDHMLKLRQRWRVALAAVVGVALFAGGALWSSSTQRRTSTQVVAAAQAAVTAAAVREQEAAARARTALERVAKATVEVRVDAKSLLTLDGKPIEAGAAVAIEPGARHVLGVQRAGHRSVRTLELPLIAGGDHVVIGLWSRGMPEAATTAIPTLTTASSATPAPSANDPGASTARGPVVEAILH